MRKHEQHTIFKFFFYFTVTQLPVTFQLKHISTYSLSGCRQPGLILGLLLWGGGDTSTTSGDGGGTSTTSRDECTEMTSVTSSSLQKQKNNSPQLTQKYTTQHSSNSIK